MRFLLVISFFISVFIFQPTAFGQGTSYESAMVVPLDRAGMVIDAIEIIGFDNEFIYCRRMVKMDHHLEKYKINDLGLVSSISNQDMIKTNDLFSFSGLPNNGEIISISKKYDKKLNKYFFYLHGVNTETMTYSAPELAASRLIPQGSQADYFFGEIKIMRSENDNFLALMHDDITEKITNDDVKKKRFDKTIYLFDKNRKLLGSSTFKRTETGFNVSDGSVSDEGMVYLTGFVYLPNPNSKSDADKFTRTQRLMSFDPKTGATKSVDVLMPDHTTLLMHCQFIPSGGAVISALTADPGGRNGSTGCITRRADASLNLSEPVYSAFDYDFLAAQWSEEQKTDFAKEQKKDPALIPALSNFSVTDIVIAENGRAIVIGEQVISKTVTKTDQYGAQVSSTTYNYNDLVILSYDAAGVLEWKTYVPKTQKSVDDGGAYSSFVSYLKDGTLNLLYNEPAAYFDGNVQASMAANTIDTDGQTVLLKVATDGTFTKYKIDGTAKLKFSPAGVADLGGGKLAFPVFNPGNESLVIVNL